MPEDKEEKSSEETKPEVEEVTEGEENPSEEEEEKIEIEPEKRFPDKKEDSRLGYKLRELERENKRLKELKGDDDLDDDEEEKPVTRKELSELLEKTERKSSSESMLQQFLSENPDFKRYEKAIRNHVDDPDYANIPIGFIASGIAGKNLDDVANERAELKRKADLEAGRTKASGSSKRNIPGSKKKVWEMTKEEFEDHQTGVLQSR